MQKFVNWWGISDDAMQLFAVEVINMVGCYGNRFKLFIAQTRSQISNFGGAGPIQ